MHHPGPTLSVSLAALTENYRILRSAFKGSACAAVVKANAYGLGVERVAPALAQAGAQHFFVATLDEGIQLRALLPQALIGVFHGPYAGEEQEYIQQRLTPVINHPEQWERWNQRKEGYILHVDTGMNRLGFARSDMKTYAEKLQANPPQLLMSHLACGNEPAHPLTLKQLETFREVRAVLTNVPSSLCNSSGIFLSAEYHYDVARPGCALYGINPTDGQNPMRHVATLSAPFLQIQTLPEEQTIGYGATYVAAKGSRIVTVQLGYADGYFRHLSNIGVAYIGTHRVPIAGRVSMDMIMLDATAVPETALKIGMAEFLNDHYTVDDAARDAGTIGYEVLTRMGRRIQRIYQD